METKMAEPLYEVKGQAMTSVGALIYLIIGVGVSVLVLVFVGSMGGQVFNTVEPDINAITNDLVSSNITEGIIAGFVALKQTGNYMPLVVLGFVTVLLLGMIIGVTSLAGPRGGGAL